MNAIDHVNDVVVIVLELSADVDKVVAAKVAESAAQDALDASSIEGEALAVLVPVDESGNPLVVELTHPLVCSTGSKPMRVPRLRIVKDLAPRLQLPTEEEPEIELELDGPPVRILQVVGPVS